MHIFSADPYELWNIETISTVGCGPQDSRIFQHASYESRTCFAPIGIYRPVTELTPRLERRVSCNYIVVALQGNLRKLSNNLMLLFNVHYKVSKQSNGPHQEYISWKRKKISSYPLNRARKTMYVAKFVELNFAGLQVSLFCNFCLSL